MILAQYTIRSKQEYIFRSNRLLDIVGGTEMIRDAFDWVFAGAKAEGVAFRTVEEPFALRAVRDAFAAGTLGMVELFRGGGNLTVLYCDRDTYKRVNRQFSRLVLENAPGMIPMADYKALMQAVDAEKNRMLPGRADYAAPFAMRDRNTNQPLVCRVPAPGGQQRELTAESLKKWEKGKRSDKQNAGNRLLDELTTEWGEESLLAIIHADGNNMGVKIQQKLRGSTDYDFCVSTMRAFTAEIADVFTKQGLACLRAVQGDASVQPGVRGSARHYRVVVADGDDFTFICNARLALAYTTAYLQAVQKIGGYSACAGICIFHSGYPVARAYRLAEQACDSAKKPVHASGAEECWLDFHYLHSGVDGDLDNIRAWQGTADLIARPWLVAGGEGTFTLANAGKLVDYIRAHRQSGTNRSNLKTIAAKREESAEAAHRELARVLYRDPGFAGALRAFSPDADDQLRALYDIAEMYDLWIAERGN